VFREGGGGGACVLLGVSCLSSLCVCVDKCCVTHVIKHKY
jgi:hypothetical protein